jgi:hypothetical protein
MDPNLDGNEANENARASAGHKLGQLVGDWFEQFFVVPLAERIARELALFADHRFVKRAVRGAGKVLWTDIEGNQVDYDVVLELGGTQREVGTPVAFLECFWRRGARHSKDKARDDTGKLLPMRDFYPTARFLGLVAAGEFTGPSRELVRSRNVDLFYVPKQKVVEAFMQHKLVMDYDDKSPESTKNVLVDEFERRLTTAAKKRAASTLTQLIGDNAVASYVLRVKAALSASPEEIRLIAVHSSEPIVFRSLQDAADFLDHSPQFPMCSPVESFVYEITYSDGSEFSRSCGSLAELRQLHSQMVMLAEHMRKML